MMNFKEIFLKSKKFSYILIFITAVGITVCSILFSKSFFMVAPLYISLFVMMLNSTANRYGILLGAINSIFYGIVYLQYGLYGTAISSFAFSAVLQFIAFVRWSKHSYKKTTVFRKLSNKSRIALITIFAVGYIATLIVLKLSGGKFIVFDAVNIPLGLIVPILNVFAYVEYTYCNLFSSVCSITLHALMIPTVPEQSAFLVYSIYSGICIVKAFFNVKDIYKEQCLDKTLTSVK